MRVAHLINSLDPAQGGPPAVVMRLASAQASSGATIMLVAPHPQSQLDAVQKSLEQVRGMERVNVTFIAPDRNVASVLSEANVDLLHVHGLWQPRLLFALRWARQNEVPFLIPPHGMLSQWSLRQKPVRKRLALAMGWRGLLTKAAYVHALNEIEASDIRKVEPRARIAVLPNGIDTAEFPTEVSAELIRDMSAGRRYVLFLARLHHVKAPDLAVDAFATIASSLPDVDLIVAGPDEGERANVIARVAQLGLGNRIRIVGPMYGPAKFALLRNTVCVIQPSRHETQSVTLLEALASGTPLVMTAACNFPEAQTAGAAIVTAGSPESLGKALQALLTDPELRRTSSERGRHLVADKFQWSRIGERFLDLYRSCSGAALANGATVF